MQVYVGIYKLFVILKENFSEKKKNVLVFSYIDISNFSGRSRNCVNGCYLSHVCPHETILLSWGTPY
jgi:hypothetical protein